MTLTTLDDPAPGAEPITLAELKAQTRVAHSHEDALMTAILSAARAEAEAITGLCIRSRRVRLTLDGFGRVVRLPVWPVRAVHQVLYDDGSGAEQTLAADRWSLRSSTKPFELWPAYGTTWPTTRLHIDAVRIDIDVGWDDVSEIPEDIRQAILLIGARHYMQREDLVVGRSVTAIPERAQRLLVGHAFWT